MDGFNRFSFNTGIRAVCLDLVRGQGMRTVEMQFSSADGLRINLDQNWDIKLIAHLLLSTLKRVA